MQSRGTHGDHHAKHLPSVQTSTTARTQVQNESGREEKRLREGREKGGSEEKEGEGGREREGFKKGGERGREATQCKMKTGKT